MGAWAKNLSLRYKFWAVNMVALATTLILMVYSINLEYQSRLESTRLEAAQRAELVSAWPTGQPLPPMIPLFTAGQTPVIEGTSFSAEPGWQAATTQVEHTGDTPPLTGAYIVKRPDGVAAVPLHNLSLAQIVDKRLSSYMIVITILMVALLTASQLLIRVLLTHLNHLKDTMLHVERTGDLSARVPATGSHDEVGQMASAFNAMQSGYQRIVETVNQAAASLDEGARHLASRMKDVRQGMLSQQSETDQVATAINAMTATVHHIAQYASTTRDQSLQADQLASQGKAVVSRVESAISGLSQGVQQTSEMIQRLSGDSQKINSVVSEIHGIAEQTNLLALNAAIEAARAGEMGRGFAVVADEVRNLARRVQESTDEITAIVAELQNGTRDAVEFMQESSLKANSCVQEALAAGQALTAITEAVTQIRDSNTRIADAAQQQSHVAEELNHSITEIRDVTDKTVQQTADSAETSIQLTGLSGQLSKAIGQLKL